MTYYELFIIYEGAPLLIANVVESSICEGFRMLMAMADIVPMEESICIPQTIDVGLNG